MRDYRVYFLDEAGQFCDVELVTADTDKEAVTIAEHLRGDRVVEVWRGNKSVARLGLGQHRG